MAIENSDGDVNGKTVYDESAYGTEENNIPAEVLDVMSKSGIGDTEIEDDTGDTETEVNVIGDNQDGTNGTEDIGKADAGVEVADDKGDDEGTGDSVADSEASGDSEDTEPIPQEQVNIARRRGWSDEMIVEIAEKHPEILEDMVALAGQQTIQPQVETKVETAPKEKREVQGVDKVELDAEALKKMKESYGDEVVDSVILPLVGGLNTTIDQLEALRGQVNGVEQTNQANQAKRNFDEANAVFDGLAETFKVFGKTDELPRLADGTYNVNSPAIQAREEVFKVATAFQASGMSWTDSLKQAVQWYKGGHVEKSLERKIVKDLNSRKKKFSPRPTSKKTKQAFKSREDEGVHIVGRAYKK